MLGARVGSVPIAVHPLTIPVFVFMIVLGDLTSALAMIWSLAVHEFAHISIARSFDCAIDELRVMPFGGEIRIEERMTPQAELAVAAAGPAASVTMAAVATLLMELFPQFYGALKPFFTTSLTLALFNILPALPLDGGRMLKAALMRVMDERASITIVSAIGFVLGCASLALGGLLFLRGSYSQFIMLGPFLILAALRERRTPYSALRDTVRKGKAVRSGMSARFRAVPKDMRARSALKNFAPGAYNMLVIVDDSLRVVGHIGEGELLDGIIRLGADVTVGEIVVGHTLRML